MQSVGGLIIPQNFVALYFRSRRLLRSLENAFFYFHASDLRYCYITNGDVEPSFVNVNYFSKTLSHTYKHNTTICIYLVKPD